MRERHGLFQVRQIQRDKRRDFWAMIRWGALIGACIWVLMTAAAQLAAI